MKLKYVRLQGTGGETDELIHLPETAKIGDECLFKTIISIRDATAEEYAEFMNEAGRINRHVVNSERNPNGIGINERFNV